MNEDKKEIDFTKEIKEEFPHKIIKANKDLTEECKEKLEIKLLSLTKDKKQFYVDSFSFDNERFCGKKNKLWINNWKNKKFKDKKLNIADITSKLYELSKMKPLAKAKELEFLSENSDFKEIEIKKELKEYIKEKNKHTNKNKNPFFIFEKESQAREFIKIQPLFFNKSEMWLIWNKEELKYEVTDKTDILNGIKRLGINTINSKERTEIINALQQVGRESIPKELDKNCIQFKNKIINIKTNEEFESTPEYFSTSPIPWKIGETEETPMMDKYFEEWVGKEYVKTLYQIIAYSCCSEQFMQRMFALVGGGSNGKGTFIKLLRKFIGKDNCVSSEMSLLSSNQFETSSLYKKLVCEMGEVSQGDLTNTNQIKKLAGGDEMRYCFKGKGAFSEFSPTTCLINTNSLPHTPDKTIGFYRKWLIIDFPNQFPVKSGIIESIPEEEFNNLAKKCITLLKEMYKTEKFENEGNYQDRMERYEERSNPIMRFIEINCEEDYESYISIKKFSQKLNEDLKNKHLRAMSPKEVKKKLTEEGFEVRRGTKEYVTDTYIFNLKLKNIPFIPNIPLFQSQSLHENLVEESGINGIKCIKPNKSSDNQLNF